LKRADPVPVAVVAINNLLRFIPSRLPALFLIETNVTENHINPFPAVIT
jgi:hypothetical protein